MPFRDHRSQDEDRNPWYDLGCAYESQFCATVAPNLGLDAMINPEKQTNPTLPDLLVNGMLSELKVRTHPFFLAEKKYGIDPQYCVMFNRKDYDYYKRCYPDLMIYWWVWWEETERYLDGYTHRVRPMTGVWRCSFGDLASHADKGIFGQCKWGNGRDSFALNLFDFYCLDLHFDQ
jgi:hypothetical protein